LQLILSWHEQSKEKMVSVNIHELYQV
jgi:hypothetical protein